MAIGKYGLKNPNVCKTGKFSTGEEYLVSFYMEDSADFINRRFRVVKDGENVIFHPTQETGDCDSLRVSKSHSRAIIDGEMCDVRVLGYLLLYEEDDILLLAGENEQESTFEVQLQTRRDKLNQVTDGDRIRVEINFVGSQTEIVVSEYKNHNQLSVRKGGSKIEIQSLTAERGNWLELGYGLFGMDAYMLQLEDKTVTSVITTEID